MRSGRPLGFARIVPVMVALFTLSGPLMMVASYFQATGDATRAAVIAFQQQHGLTADGIVGPRTIMRLRAVRGDAGPRLGEG